MPKITNFLERFDTVISLNYDLILYWAILWANDHSTVKYFKDCFIKEGEFESDWHWLRGAYGGRESTLVFYPHGNLVLATDFFGDTRKIIRDGSLIEIEGKIYKVTDSDLMQSIVEAWESNRQIIQSSYNEVSLRDGFIVEAISSSVVETATLGYAFLEVTLFVRILSVISIS